PSACKASSPNAEHHRPTLLLVRAISGNESACVDLTLTLTSIFRMLRIQENITYEGDPMTLIEDPLILVHYFKYATTLERYKGDMSCVWGMR
ncbi:hypothetical protein Tco_1040393, partial [Tanacetum coccineum]